VYFWHTVQGQEVSFLGAPNLPREKQVNAGMWKDVENQ